MAISSDGGRIVSGDYSGHVIVWEAGTLRVWSRERLALERSMVVSTARGTNVAKLLCVLAGVGKLLVLDSDSVFVMRGSVQELFANYAASPVVFTSR